MNIMSGRKKIGFILIALLYACSGGSGSEDPEPTPEPTPEPVRKEIKMLLAYRILQGQQMPLSRLATRLVCML